MIDLKALKDESLRFPEPLKSLIELAKDRMDDQEFISEFLKLRKKAREMDAERREIR